MKIVSMFLHSTALGVAIPVDNSNVEKLIELILTKLDVSVENIINIQIDGPYGASEWGIRVFAKSDLEDKSELAFKQAQIDSLMLEFCSERMTEAQKENWAKHQVPSDHQLSIKDISGYEKIISNDQLLIDHYYWILSKQYPGDYSIAQVKLAKTMLSETNDDNNYKALVVNNMYFWAHEKNSQAIETFDIYGPIIKPFHIIDMCSSRS